jgi:hypothetical protein
MPILQAFAALARRASIVVDDRQFCPTSPARASLLWTLAAMLQRKNDQASIKATTTLGGGRQLCCAISKMPARAGTSFPLEIECTRSKDRLERAA